MTTYRCDWWFPSDPPRPFQRAEFDSELAAEAHAHTLAKQGAQAVVYAIEQQETA